MQAFRSMYPDNPELPSDLDEQQQALLEHQLAIIGNELHLHNYLIIDHSIDFDFLNECLMIPSFISSFQAYSCIRTVA